MTKAFRPEIVFDASPHFSDRGGKDIDGLVLHYTAGIHSIGWMKDPISKASAHFLIDRDGKCTQLVELSKSAWHAGHSVMPYKGHMSNNPNLFTVGIELENVGMVHKDDNGIFHFEVNNHLVAYPATCGKPIQGSFTYGSGHAVSGFWEPFYEPQLEKLTWLLGALENDYPGITSNMYGHNEIAQPVGRKVDPAIFPWSRFNRDPKTMKVTITSAPWMKPVA